MRLTNAMRDVFVRAVILDVPQVDYGELIRARVLEMVKGHYPPLVSQAAKQHPDWLHRTNIYVEREVKGRRTTVVGVSFIFSTDGEAYRAFRAEVNNDPEVGKLCDSHLTQAEIRNTLQSELTALAQGCGTREQLLKAAPTFAAYLPDPEVKASALLPVTTDLVRRLKKQGWPKK